MKKIIYSIILIFLLSAASHAHAATLYFDPQDHDLGLDQNFSLGLMIDADTAVNTFSVSLQFPTSLVPVDTSDGNSIINLWIEKPHYDELTHTLTFSGVIPGGFIGKGGRLLLLKVHTMKAGNFIVDYDKSKTQIFQNTPTADRDTVTTIPVTFAVIQGKENIENILPDTVPPNSFAPVLIHDPLIDNGKWLVAFDTEDKGVGLARFEVSESLSSTTAYDSLTWQTAESPYELHDQKMHSYIYVRAIDKNNNARVEMLGPVSPLPWYERSGSYILVSIIVLIIFIGLYAKALF
jgi:hypothetical protein